MIKTITIQNEVVTLSNSLDYSIRCQQKFGHSPLKILNDSEANLDDLAVIKVVYCMITPEPKYSFDDFCKKLTPKDLPRIADTFKELYQDGQPTAEQSKKIKN